MAHVVLRALPAEIPDGATSRRGREGYVIEHASYQTLAEWTDGAKLERLGMGEGDADPESDVVEVPRAELDALLSLPHTALKSDLLAAREALRTATVTTMTTIEKIRS